MFKKPLIILIVLSVFVFNISACAPKAEENVEVERVEEATSPPREQEVEVEQAGPAAEEEVVPLLTISDVYAGQEDFLGSQITVEGYYSIDGPSYLLSDYDYASANTFIPIDSMLILSDATGGLSIQNDSAYIHITGTLLRYGNDYPEYIDDNGEFLAFQVEDWKVIDPPIIEILEYLEPTQPEGYLDERISGPECLWVLIVSGAPYTFPGTMLTSNNHDRYWNDTLFAYQMSTRLGAQWIQVLYSTGAPPPLAFVGRLPGNIPAADLQAATNANLSAAFTTIGQTIPGDCQLWIITTDHGIGWSPPNKIGFGPGANYMVSGWGRIDGAPPDAVVPGGDPAPGDEIGAVGVGNVVNADQGDDVDEGLVLWQDVIYDDSFAFELSSNVNDVLDAYGIAYEIYVMMEQCYSGGFIDELSPLVANIATASSEDQSSWGMRIWPIFDEFLYYFITALNQADPWGRPIPAPIPPAPVNWWGKPINMVCCTIHDQKTHNFDKGKQNTLYQIAAQSPFLLEGAYNSPGESYKVLYLQCLFPAIKTHARQEMGLTLGP